METTFKIFVFGQLQDFIGSSVIDIETVNDTELLLQKLFEKYATLKEKKFKVAVNKKIIEKKIILNSTDEIALLPPFSGG